MTRTVLALALLSTAFSSALEAQTLFGSGCAGASGVTPTLAVSGAVKSGANWTLEVAAPGGIGLGYLAIGFSNTSASAFGGLPLPLDLGVFFGDPLWSGCSLNVDPSYALAPYGFDPNTSGGLATFTFPGFDVGTVFVQAVNIDPDFATRIAGTSRGVAVRPAPTGMVAIAPGTFQMGSNAPGGAPYFDGLDDDLVHTVTISQPFWMAEREVTQAEYQAVMGAHSSGFSGPNRPVEQVSWNNARAYCTALTVAGMLAGDVPAGYEYRLPTEAEWEYACRAGTTTEFNTGSALFCDQAAYWYSYHSNTHCAFFATVDVGSYAPNAWGLFDMHGNVAEWCLDSYASYSAAATTDPFVTGGFDRVVRGGAWSANSSYCRSAVRFDGNQSSSFATVGIRVVLAPILVP
jgi:formylglycine-generating enzyme required for sulfatase activity